MKKSYFIIANALLVIIVGILIGVFCSDILVGVKLAAFICMLIVLCCPTIVLFTKEKITFPTLVDTCVFLVAELAINILFMAVPSFEVKGFAITQSCVIGTFLVVLLIAMASKDNKAEIEA